MQYIGAKVGVRDSPYLGTVNAANNISGRASIPYVRQAEKQSGSGTQISAGLINDIDQNADVRGSAWYGAYGGIGVSRKMMRDPHVRQSVAYITDPLRVANWRFKPASNSPLHKEQADFLTWAFIEQFNWDEFLKRTVTGYVVDGFALVEFTDAVKPLPRNRFPAHGGNGQALVPGGAYDVPANTISRWYPNEKMPVHLAMVEQWQPFNPVEQTGHRDLELQNRILRFTYEQEGANFAGMSLLRSAYGAWKMRLALLAIMAIKHERRGVGIPVVILGEDVSDEDIDNTAETLEQMRANAKGYAVFPHGYEFRWEGGSQSQETNIETAIEMVNRDIAYNVSCGFMLLGSAGKTGSWALSSTQQSQYHLSTVGHAKFFADKLVLGADGWSPVERLLKLNYSVVDALPTLEARNLPTRNWLDVMPQAINAVNAGLITPDDLLEAEAREIFQFGPADKATAKPRGQAAQIQNNQEQNNVDE